MSGAEQELRRLAAGTSWHLDNLTQMRASVVRIQARVRRVEDAIRNGEWESASADVAAEHLHAMERTLENASAWLDEVSRTISAHNAAVQAKAQQELENLPMGDLPSTVRDAIDQGKPQAMTPYGLIGLGTGPLGLALASQFFAEQRERAAEDAKARMETYVKDRRDELSRKLEVGFDVIEPRDGERDDDEDSSDWSNASDGVGGSGGPGGWPGGGTGGGPGGPGWPGDGGGPGGPGGPGDGGGGPGDGGGGPGDGGGGPADGGGGPGEPPSEPPLPPPYEPPVYPPYDPPNDPDGPGGNGGGGGTGGGTGGGGPSVDSRLDGSTLRSGLGAAGLGAAGLAAGAKLAGAGVAGGLAQGLGLTGGPGLQGAASVASAGGGSGSGSGSSGAGRGMRPGGMMMGGAGAGGAEEKKPKSGLGGYLAPKLEDEDEGGPAARASRAGSRDGS